MVKNFNYILEVSVELNEAETLLYIVKVITASHLSKKFKKKLAVNDLSFSVQTGKVTGFVGPNGAGKSTTMRLMLGLDNGRGRTLFDNKPLNQYPRPSQIVGILLEAKAFHPTRTARNHLRVLAAAANLPNKRVDEVLDIVGLSHEANKKPGRFSLGMAQRLGIAAAILSQPKYLLLDEPANGLDPEGISWLRKFIKDYAAKGNGVFVSSHLLSEMSQMADNVVVIGRGKLIADTSIKGLVDNNNSSVFVRVNNKAALVKALKQAGLAHQAEGAGLLVHSAKSDDIGRLAHQHKLTVLELTQSTVSLEDAFLALTADAQEYQAKDGRSGKPS